MRKTRIFVSSTCYDLGPVRETIRQTLREMGHEPILSEYSSFPIDPLAGTVVNCRKNVRENTDLLLLLIGDTYGSIDPESDKSITNLEFDTATTEGIPVFVFVKKSMLTLLPTWNENPDLKIPGVPDNRAFNFIQAIRDQKLWTYGFEHISDIKDVLSDQLSFMFRDLLERRAAGKLDPILSFRGESEKARRLALEKPKFWEFSLSAELIRGRFSRTTNRYRRLREGFIHVPLRTISGSDFFVWIQDYFANLMSVVAALGKQFEISFKASLGPPGVPGDPEAILSEVNEMDSLLNMLIDCERELMAHRPPEVFIPLQRTAVGVVDVVFDTFGSLPDKLVEPFRDGDPPPGKVFEIMLEFPSPDLSRYEAELEKLEQLLFDDPSSVRL